MNWTCPYCQRDQVVTSGQRSYKNGEFTLDFSRFEKCGYTISAVACSNKDCGEVTLLFTFGKGEWKSTHGGQSYFSVNEATCEPFRLRPSTYAKPQPEAVPDVLVKDYNEACAIRDLSPKASATLSRRVLQAMIRDFCKIEAPNLYQEIEALHKMANAGNAPPGVALETIDAMHSVRSVGNIGAHMEKDINVIVDVDPAEAQALIELIEMLFDEWYVERAKRLQKLEAIKAIGADKAQAKLPSPQSSE